MPSEQEEPVDVDGYVVEDDFFGKPYIDVDEERTDPLPHRFVHGGFEGTDTRFTFYFPPAEVYRSRLLHPIEGGLGGAEVEELATLIRRLVDDWNLGVLVIEHDVSFVMSVCDDIAVLDFGQQIAYGAPDEIRNDPRVLGAYLGQVEPDVTTDGA